MPSLKSSYPLYLANEALTPNQDLEVTDKYSGKVATRVAMADATTIDRAIGAAVETGKPEACRYIAIPNPAAYSSGSG